MSFFSKLGKILSVGAGVAAAPFTGGASLIPTVIGAAGSALGGAADASANNRGAQIDATAQAEALNLARKRQYVDQLLARESEGRASGNDAFRNVERAEYLANAEGYTPKAGLKSFGFGPKASTEAERTAAANFRGEAEKRLQGGNPIPEVRDPGDYRVDPKLMKPSGFEKFANVASPLLTGVGAIADAKSDRDSLEGLRKDFPDLDEHQLAMVAEALKSKGVRF